MYSLANRVIACILTIVLGTAYGGEPRFSRQSIDDQIEIGYGLAIGRVDDDEHQDVLLADKTEIVWYRNPGSADQEWTKHVMARKLTNRDNVCLAARDLNGDGLVEVAVGADWNPGETSDASVSGALFYLQRPSDPRKPWKPVSITPHDPTTHRMHWIATDAGFRLAVLPLHGVGNKSGEGSPVMVNLYEVASDVPRLVSRIDTQLHMTHNFELVTDAEFSEHEFMTIGGKEGVIVARPDGVKHEVIGSSLSKGVGEVRRYPVPQRAIVAIEPMHGTDVVLYEKADEGDWRKTTIDATLSEGHALAAGDVCGDGVPEVIAGWRGRDSQGKVGIRLYTKLDNAWKSHVVDDNQIACEDLKLVDLDGDKKLDIVAAGRATKNLVVFWNRSDD